jgi:HD-GYP domain-containing protein (c-di-GMP phosphodiesterase class II)
VAQNKIIVTDDSHLRSKLDPYWNLIDANLIYLLDFLTDIDTYLNEKKMIQTVFLLSAENLLNHHKNIKNFLKQNLNFLSSIIVLAPVEEEVISKTEIENDLFFMNIPSDSPAFYLARSIMNAYSMLLLKKEKFELNYKVNLSASHIAKLTKIGMSLATEKDFTKLLHDILFSSREICVADAGSLYLTEKDENGVAKYLRFKISALDLNSSEFLLPINKKSISGYVAYTGQVLNIPDAYHLPEGVEFSFNSDYDRTKNYYSKSMLVVPMKNNNGEVIGVIQLINRKKNFQKELTQEDMKGDEVIPFDRYSEELVMSVAGQAAVAIQNNNLIQDIEKLFEGFVTASVSAIEARDPTTSGHSFRVAELTVGLAKVVDSLEIGKFSNVKFTFDQMKEIRYASLLHDFGKVGVREKVLVKSKKIENYELENIEWRFFYLMKDIEAKLTQKKIDYLKKRGSDGFFEFEKAIDLEIKLEKEKLQTYIDIVRKCNEPTVLEQSSSNVLEDIAKMEYQFFDGSYHPLINSKEFNYLSIKKGSLDYAERLEIESHVEHTYQFLSKIPWIDGLKMIPKIAHAHHEKLDGTGYPRKLNADEIPIQSRMMTIADIYDALTDKDRPYKKAVPIDRALDILKMEVKDNHIDGELLDIFIHKKVFNVLNDDQKIG